MLCLSVFTSADVWWGQTGFYIHVSQSVCYSGRMQKKKEPKLSQNVDNVRREQNEMLGSEQNDEEEKGKRGED